MLYGQFALLEKYFNSLINTYQEALFFTDPGLDYPLINYAFSKTITGTIGKESFDAPS